MQATLTDALQKARKGVPYPHDYWLNPVIAFNEEGDPRGNIEPGDVIIHFDFRSDRSVALLRVLADPTFNQFPISSTFQYLPFAPYDPDLCEELHIKPLFERTHLYEDIPHTATDVWERAGKTVAYIAETEKFRHTTFFFWGRTNKSLQHGYTQMIHSNNIKDHSQKPAMKADDIATIALDCMYGRTGMKKADVVVLNFANLDILKHTGNHDAIKKGAEAVDRNLGRILKAVKELNGFALITADHGAGEETKELDGYGNFIQNPETGDPIPAVQHSYGTKVPFIIYGFEKHTLKLQSNGSIVNVIPTMLHLQGIEKPSEMAESLVTEAPTKDGPAVLIIRDGYGIRKYDTPDARSCDATLQAHTPEDDRLRRECPYTELLSHGKSVGLPEFQMGDSDTCHMQLGAGRVIEQPLSKICTAIETRELFRNENILSVLRKTKKTGNAVVLIGMVSEGGVHSHISSLFALLELCKHEDVKTIKIHCIHDSRDVPLFKTADYYTHIIEDKIDELGLTGKAIIATHQGRGLIKDRDAINKMQAANRELLACIKKCLDTELYKTFLSSPVSTITEQLKNKTIGDYLFMRKLETLSSHDIRTVLHILRLGAVSKKAPLTPETIDRIERNIQFSKELWKERIEPGYRALVFGEGIKFLSPQS